MKEIKHIQVLRGLAVLGVMAYHFDERLYRNGFLGVDVFFVISGFVIAPQVLRITSDRNLAKKRLKNFTIRRSLRLIPALNVCLLSSSMLILAFAPIYDFQRIARQGFASFLMAGNLGAVRYSGDYFNPNPNPFLHTWSLAVEYQMYLLIPLLIILLMRTFGVSSIMSAVLIIGFISYTLSVFIALGNLFLEESTRKVWNLFAFYAPVTRFWQFALGMVSFLIFNRVRIILSERLVNVTKFLTTSFITALMFFPIEIDRTLSALAICLLTTVCLVLSRETLKFHRIEKILFSLGNRSYSLYLYHVPILYLSNYSPLFSTWNIPQLLKNLVAVIILFTMSEWSWRRVETKFRTIGKRYSI